MHARALRAIILSTLGACSPYGLEGNSPRVAPVPSGASTTADAMGMLSPDVCRQACITSDRESVKSCHLATLVESNQPRIVCDIYFSQSSGGSLIGPLPAGRVPEGFVDALAPHDVSSYFAASAQLEAASVIAFVRLATDLARHRAPESLRKRARRAARDEVRHAKTFRRLAKHVPEVRVLPVRPRSLEQVARENVVEGCVRETYAALVAHHQAMHAIDPKLRRTMRRIARDEARHAALAWSVHRWAMSKLGTRARARIERARVTAERQLVDECAAPTSLTSTLGIPSGAHARALARTLALALTSS